MSHGRHELASRKEFVTRAVAPSRGREIKTTNEQSTLMTPNCTDEKYKHVEQTTRKGPQHRLSAMRWAEDCMREIAVLTGVDEALRNK